MRPAVTDFIVPKFGEVIFKNWWLTFIVGGEVVSGEFEWQYLYAVFNFLVHITVQALTPCEFASAPAPLPLPISSYRGAIPI